MTVSNFLVEIRLASRLILRKPWLTGDSLLAGILNMRYNGDYRRAIAETKKLVSEVAGVPQMSVWLPYSYASPDEVEIAFIRNIMRDMEHDRDLAHILNRMPSRSDLTPSQGPLGSIRNTYPSYDIPKVYFLGRGDQDAIERIIGDAGFIGPQRNRGMGQVASVRAYEVETDNRFFGIIGKSQGRNVVLRPIPVRLKAMFPSKLVHSVTEQTWHNPYLPVFNSSVVEPCMAPLFETGETFHEQQIETELATLA